jgi:hypothetical protein
LTPNLGLGTAYPRQPMLPYSLYTHCEIFLHQYDMLSEMCQLS